MHLHYITPFHPISNHIISHHITILLIPILISSTSTTLLFYKLSIPYSSISHHLSQLILDLSPLLRLKSPSTQIRHPHNLNHQTCPPSEMLSSLSHSRFRIILFPRKSCFLPTIIDRLDKIQSKFRVEIFRFFLVGTRNFCVFL